MHLPDGFLDTKTWTTLTVVGAAGVALALRQLQKSQGESDSTTPSTRAPVVGLCAAFVFAAQMVNFPVATAVSGHLLGGTLLAILLGPWMGVLVMTAVLVIQALLFQDGGITALGANVVNLAFIATLSGYGLYRLILGSETSSGWSARKGVAVFVGAWASAVLSALAAAAELAVSGVADIGTLLGLMGGVHAIIGLGEGLVTLLVLRYLTALGYGAPGGLTKTLHPSQSHG
ncbi:MAG: energy-coupling factor ABC transporter permease [Verrucomicrobiales bacterium]|nr:energy-coupling factor ABC transporter permease [Verrucomicrobiales bacterium]